MRFRVLNSIQRPYIFKLKFSSFIFGIPLSYTMKFHLKKYYVFSFKHNICCIKYYCDLIQLLICNKYCAEKRKTLLLFQMGLYAFQGPSLLPKTKARIVTYDMPKPFFFQDSLSSYLHEICTLRSVVTQGINKSVKCA